MSADHHVREDDDLGFDPISDSVYGKHFGVYKATVKAVNDPNKEGRVRLHIPMVMGGEPGSEQSWSDWAEPQRHSSDGTDMGSCDVPVVESLVWVQFKGGHPDYPVYSTQGFATQRKPMLALARGESDNLGGEAKSVGGVTVPASLAGSSEYPLNRVWKTKSGHIVEFDESTGKRRFRVRHPGGSFIEMTHAGDMVQQILGDFLLWAGGNVKHAATSNYVIAVGAMCKIGSDTASKKLLTDSFTSKFNRLRTEYLTHVHPLSSPNTGTPVSAASTTTQPLTDADYTTKLVSE